MQSEFSPGVTWNLPDSSLERVLCATPRRSLAFRVQSFLYAKHKVRAALKAQDELWVLEYHPAPDGMPLEEARAICEAFLVALRAVCIPTN
jgi:hypothetical protein